MASMPQDPFTTATAFNVALDDIRARNVEAHWYSPWGLILTSLHTKDLDSNLLMWVSAQPSLKVIVDDQTPFRSEVRPDFFGRIFELNENQRAVASRVCLVVEIKKKLADVESSRQLMINASKQAMLQACHAFVNDPNLHHVGSISISGDIWTYQDIERPEDPMGTLLSLLPKRDQTYDGSAAHESSSEGYDSGPDDQTPSTPPPVPMIRSAAPSPESPKRALADSSWPAVVNPSDIQATYDLLEIVRQCLLAEHKTYRQNRVILQVRANEGVDSDDGDEDNVEVDQPAGDNYTIGLVEVEEVEMLYEGQAGDSDDEIGYGEVE